MIPVSCCSGVGCKNLQYLEIDKSTVWNEVGSYIHQSYVTIIKPRLFMTLPSLGYINKGF